jgi:hypothetical protein
MVTKHTSTNNLQCSTNVLLTSTKQLLSSASNLQASTPDLPKISNNKQCGKCSKCFAKRCTMLKHYEKCKGIINPLECQHCEKILKYKKNMAAHIKICKGKALVLSSAVSSTPSITNNNNTTNNNINNITNNNIINNNITNNTQNITINCPLVFEENKPFLSDHIQKEALKNIIKTQSDFVELMTLFSKDILKREENQCVRKTNLRSASSIVHVGDDVWEAQADSQVMPRVLCNMAMSLSESMEQHALRMREALGAFIEDLTCYGEHGNSDPDEILNLKQCYKKAMANIKHTIFNVTKQAIGAQRALAIVE